MAILKPSTDGSTLVLPHFRVAYPRSLTSPTSLTFRTPTGRSFSWGAKHKWATNHKAKNFSEKVYKASIYKFGLRSPYLEHQAFVRRFLPAQGWRSASHWRTSRPKCENDKDSEQTSPNKQHDHQMEDWYARWERQQIEKFEAFKKKIDQDPFDALFGRSSKWLSWTYDNTFNEYSGSEGPTNVLKKKASEYLKNDKARKARKETTDSVPNGESVRERTQRGASDHLVKHELVEQEYEIDPITLRKIPKMKNSDHVPKETGKQSTQQAFDIPIKAFKPAPRSTTVPAKSNSSTQVDDWLAREGFGSSKDTQKTMSPQEYGTILSSKTPASKIESALDRHVSERHADSEKVFPTDKSTGQEKIDKDIDSLRASDIRASVGKGVQQKNASNPALNTRRQASEERHEQLQHFLNEKMKRNESDFKHLEKLNRKTVLSSSAGADAAIASRTTKELNDSSVNELSGVSGQTEKSSNLSAALPSEVAKGEKLSSYMNDNTLHIQSKIVPLKMQIDSMKAEYDRMRQTWLNETRRLKAKKTAQLLDEEVAAQKAAMEAAEVHRGEGDMAPNVHQFLTKKTSTPAESVETSRAQCGGEGDMAPNVAQYASRDRWYKRKAPHAQCEMEAKMEQLAKDKALVREVRGIYEDTYGTIDTKHRQEEHGGEGDMSPNVAQFAARDRWYKRKAPFNVNDGVVVPKQETSTDKGYQMLKEDPSAEVLTKNPPPTSATTPSPVTPPSPEIAALKAQLAHQAAQLQAFRHEIQSLRAHSANKGDKAASVRRLEPVFSGGGRRNKERKRASRRRQTLRHVLLTGAVTAACCYATGVAVEVMSG